MSERITVLGANHLASQGWELQRKNTFEIIVSGIDNTERLLTMSVVSGDLPSDSNQVIEVKYGNSSVKIAGQYSINNGTLVLRDFLEKDTEAMVEKWREKVYNKRTNAVNFAFDYWKTARIIQAAPDGTHIREWKLFGVWPSAVSYGSLSQNDSEVKEISITLEYNRAEIVRK